VVVGPAEKQISVPLHLDIVVYNQQLVQQKMHVVLLVHVKMVGHVKLYQVDHSIAFVHKIIMEKLVTIVSKLIHYEFHLILFVL
jgi:hypothetical protein